MSSSAIPVGQWIPPSTLSRLQSVIDTFPAEGLASDLNAFSAHQSEFMLAKLFLEQSHGGGQPGPTSRDIIQRDFGSLDGLRRQWALLADDERVDWIVVGLCFADFRFHVFPLGAHHSPFCVSPVISACLIPELLDESGIDRYELVDLQWQTLNWSVVEARFACLTKPLDLFEEPIDCIDNCQ